jgi:hypothetical protein
MAHGVHAAVDRMQAAPSDAVIDPSVPQPQRRQLAPRHDPVLTRREGGDPRVRRSSGTFGMTVTLDRHDAIVAGGV